MRSNCSWKLKYLFLAVELES
uniref:G protein alpha subunit n=1 Tax=Arabidopsis thaliana TaxID=3702 RepID=V9GZD1_ARATH|nr:G protein alpha subunit [Arabidopsis thaliana]